MPPYQQFLSNARNFNLALKTDLIFTKKYPSCFKEWIKEELTLNDWSNPWVHRWHFFLSEPSHFCLVTTVWANNWSATILSPTTDPGSISRPSCWSRETESKSRRSLGPEGGGGGGTMDPWSNPKELLATMDNSSSTPLFRGCPRSARR